MKQGKKLRGERGPLRKTDLDISNRNINEVKLLPHLQILNITALHLDHNNLTFVPSEIQNLVHLELLNLYHNQLEDIENIYGLKYLNTLVISHNKITYIPPHIFFSLPKLKVLQASNNFISSLPDSLSCAKKLRTLNLCHNKLSWLSLNICKLPLKDVRLNGNNLTMVPKALAKKIQIGYTPNPSFEPYDEFHVPEHFRHYGVSFSPESKFYFDSSRPNLVQIGGGDIRDTTSIDPSLFETYLDQQEIYTREVYQEEYKEYSRVPLSGPNMLPITDVAYNYDRTCPPQNSQECLSLQEQCGRVIRTNNIDARTLPSDIRLFLFQFKKCICGKNYYSNYNCIVVEFHEYGRKYRRRMPVWEPICSILCAKNLGYINWKCSYKNRNKTETAG